MGINVCLILFILTSFLTESVSASPAVQLIGDFSNQTTSVVAGDPHMEGYSLSLYRRGQAVFGRFCQAMGIEVACSPIKEAAIDRKGAIQFSTTLRVGTEVSEATGPNGKPAYRFLKFEGTLKRSFIAGTLSSTTSVSNKASTTTERIKLRRSKQGLPVRKMD